MSRLYKETLACVCLVAILLASMVGLYHLGYHEGEQFVVDHIRVEHAEQTEDGEYEVLVGYKGELYLHLCH